MKIMFTLILIATLVMVGCEKPKPPFYFTIESQWSIKGNKHAILLIDSTNRNVDDIKKFGQWPADTNYWTLVIVYDDALAIVYHHGDGTGSDAEFKRKIKYMQSHFVGDFYAKNHKLVSGNPAQFRFFAIDNDANQSLGKIITFE